MPADVRRAYVAPYDSWDNRIATLRFVQDIPLARGDPAWALVDAGGRALPDFADRPAFIGWGLRDFVFDKHFLDGSARWPQAEVHAFEDAGHYVLEDKHEVLVPAIRDVPRRASARTRERASMRHLQHRRVAAALAASVPRRRSRCAARAAMGATTSR